MLNWGKKSAVTDIDARFAHVTEAAMPYDDTLHEWTKAVGTDRYRILVSIEGERNHLRAENAELRRQVAELTNRLAAMEAKACP